MGKLQNERKRRILKRAVAKVILIVMIVSVIMIAFLLLFQVRKIEVSGNQYLTKQEIADWMEDDELSTNSAYLMIKYHLMDYSMLPAMEDVKVTMKNPWTMKVTVKEKRIAGYIVFKEDCVYFDKDGIVLAQTKELWDGIPCIEGLDVSKVELYKELPVSTANKKAFANLLDMSLTLKKCELTPDKIVCSGSDLYLYFGNKCVNVGHANLEERIMQISPILEKLGEQGGTLHLEDFNDNNTTITFEKEVSDTSGDDTGDGSTEDSGDESVSSE